MSIEGTLDELKVPDILQMVAQQGNTGILTVQGENTIIAISFLAGDVVAADSLQETVEDRLGEVLVREGTLTREKFTDALEAQSGSQGRLIDFLVDEGYLSRQDILDSLRSQTRDLLVELMGWTTGDFKFYANDEVAYEEGFQPIVVGELLISLLPGDGGGGADGEGSAELGGELDGDLDSGGEVFEGSFTQLPEAGASAEDDWPGLSQGFEPGQEGGGAGFTDHGELGGLDLRQPGFTEPPLEDPSEGESFTDQGGALGKVVPLPVTQRDPEPEPEPVLDDDTIFVPPDDALPEMEKGAPEEAAPWPRPATAALGWGPAVAEEPGAPRVGNAAALLPPALAALLVAAVVVALATVPTRVLLPLPWQDSEREHYEMAQRQALYRSIDGAAKTFFLLEGRFPDRLDRLVEASLLRRQDLTGPAGRRLEMEAREESYVLRPVTEDGAAPEPATVATEAITGNFLLDPEYLSAQPVDTVPPLVLLD